METPLITYNLKERGRRHTGVERNFDIPRVVKAINSDECQERVAQGDMLGFYGHWPRQMFGMTPPEGAVVDGKVVYVQPALVTTYLKAHKDGTIQHKAKFLTEVDGLKNEAGLAAAALFKLKKGGFSSAIDTGKPMFYGLDYVHQPNYTTNRGYTFDSVLCAGGICQVGMSFEELIEAIKGEQQDANVLLFDSVAQFMSANEVAGDVLASLEKELQQALTANEKHITTIARLKKKHAQEIAALENNILDSAKSLIIDRSAAQTIVKNVNDFWCTPIAVEQEPDSLESKAMLRQYIAIRNRYLR